VEVNSKEYKTTTNTKKHYYYVQISKSWKLRFISLYALKLQKKQLDYCRSGNIYKGTDYYLQYVQDYLQVYDW